MTGDKFEINSAAPRCWLCSLSLRCVALLAGDMQAKWVVFWKTMKAEMPLMRNKRKSRRRSSGVFFGGRKEIRRLGGLGGNSLCTHTRDALSARPALRML
jgi:hypothetical protein